MGLFCSRLTSLLSEEQLFRLLLCKYIANWLALKWSRKQAGSVPLSHPSFSSYSIPHFLRIPLFLPIFILFLFLHSLSFPHFSFFSSASPYFSLFVFFSLLTSLFFLFFIPSLVLLLLFRFLYFLLAFFFSSSSSSFRAILLPHSSSFSYFSSSFLFILLLSILLFLFLFFLQLFHYSATPIHLSPLLSLPLCLSLPVSSSPIFTNIDTSSSFLV